MRLRSGGSWFGCHRRIAPSGGDQLFGFRPEASTGSLVAPYIHYAQHSSLFSSAKRTLPLKRWWLKMPVKIRLRRRGGRVSGCSAWPSRSTDSRTRRRPVPARLDSQAAGADRAGRAGGRWLEEAGGQGADSLLPSSWRWSSPGGHAKVTSGHPSARSFPVAALAAFAQSPAKTKI